MEYPEFMEGWKTVRVIGQGSFGTVYEIQRDVLGTIEKCALKVISIPRNQSDIDDLTSDGYDMQSIVDRYRACLKDMVQEYSLMASLKGNSNIVDCEDLRYTAHEDGYGWDLYIRMELLTPMVRKFDGDIPEPEAVRLGIDIAQALVLCSSLNIIHRDIKPQNIFVSRYGKYKLGDFGIAKVSESMTNGTRIGTIRYMAPEVFNGKPYGAPADIYSLGMVMYWMLNERRLPFMPMPPQAVTTAAEEEAKRRIYSGEPIPPPAHGSAKLKKIVCRACAFSLDERYSSAEEMLNDLKQLTGTQEAENTGSRTGPGSAAVTATDIAAAANQAQHILAGDPAAQPGTAVLHAAAAQPAAKTERGNSHKIGRLVIGVIVCIAVICIVIAVHGIWRELSHSGDNGTEEKLSVNSASAVSVSQQPDTAGAVEAAESTGEGSRSPDPAADSAVEPAGAASAQEKSSAYAAIRDAAIGDVITFGTYEQDNDTDNGQEDIEWYVLSRENGKMLILSKYVLVCRAYHASDTDVTWETCSLRTWLNQTFYTAAFSDEEREMIQSTQLPSGNPDDTYASENVTTDSVFLLSVEEVESYIPSERYRVCQATAYAAACGAYTDPATGNSWWWLRSPGKVGDYAARVNVPGMIEEDGIVVQVPDGCVRPAMWIEIPD